MPHSHPTPLPTKLTTQAAESQLGEVEERAVLNEERWKDAERRLKETDAKATREMAQLTATLAHAQGAVADGQARETTQRETIATGQAREKEQDAVVQSLRRDVDRLEGERNAMKKKATGLKRDMARIFRACGGKSFEDVEALVRERRELQVAVKVQKAERDAAKDDLRAYKDALQRQLVDNAKGKKKSLRTRIREKAEKATGRKLGGGAAGSSSSGGGGGSGDDPGGFSLEELQNLTFKLMDQVEERDERMSLKELEKRQLFDRIIALETKLDLVGGDGGSGEEEAGEEV